MKIEAHVDNSRGQHRVRVSTQGRTQEIAIAPRETGLGSNANGGELLCLALATCYCNDVYREAAQRGLDVVRVRVDVAANFGAPGEPAKAIGYRADIEARADEPTIMALMLEVDRVAEIQNTLRQGMAVRFEPGKATTLS